MRTATIDDFKKAVIEVWQDKVYLQIMPGPKLFEDAMADLAFKLFGDDSLVKEKRDEK